MLSSERLKKIEDEITHDIDCLKIKILSTLKECFDRKDFESPSLLEDPDGFVPYVRFHEKYRDLCGLDYYVKIYNTRKFDDCIKSSPEHRYVIHPAKFFEKILKSNGFNRIRSKIKRNRLDKGVYGQEN